MQIHTTVTALREALAPFRQADETIGFVPTMGALHDGHLALFAAARATTDRVVGSIFVNPTQFNDPTDLARYPRPLVRDQQLLREAGCDVLFLPSEAEMYPAPTRLHVDFGALAERMEGAHRPGHFNGVALIVSKLFHAVGPDVAFFGQKDLQQFAIVRQLVSDLSFPLRLVRCPTVREPDGLALSSRNARLTAGERAVAPALYAALRAGADALPSGTEACHRAFTKALAAAPALRPEYFAVVDPDTLQPVERAQVGSAVALCTAAHLGSVRLIDNLIVNPT